MKKSRLPKPTSTIAVALITIGALTNQANAAYISTIFATNNSYDGNMFDVNVLTNPVTITSFDLNLVEAATAYSINVYTKQGTWVGFESNAAAWNLIGTYSVTSTSPDNATFLDVDNFTLAANSTNALYITSNDIALNLAYTDGTAIGDIAAQDANIQILQGSGNAYPFGSIATPRTWNGGINYDVVPEPSTSALLLGVCGLTFALTRRRK